MPTGIYLINGISSSYHVIDAAIKWAEQNKASLTGIYIYSGEKNAESYGFPSDIEKAETLVSENEGEAELENLILDLTRYAEHQGSLRNISITTYRYKDPGTEELQQHLQQADILFADPDTFKGEADSEADLSLEDILQQTPVQLTAVRS